MKTETAVVEEEEEEEEQWGMANPLRTSEENRVRAWVAAVDELAADPPR